MQDPVGKPWVSRGQGREQKVWAGALVVVSIRRNRQGRLPRLRLSNSGELWEAGSGGARAVR